MRNDNVIVPINLLIIIVVLFLFNLMSGCAHRQNKTTEDIVLTEEQKRILIITGNPSTNRKLRKDCGVVAVERIVQGGGLGEVGLNENQLRLIASGKEGNIIETIQATENNTTTMYGVTTQTFRSYIQAAVIYKCPEGFILQ